MTQKFHNIITDDQDKRIYIAFWPGEEHEPEVWTQSDIEADFGDGYEFMSLVNALTEGESIHETDSNLVLVRIPSYLSLEGIFDLMTQTPPEE